MLLLNTPSFTQKQTGSTAHFTTTLIISNTQTYTVIINSCHHLIFNHLTIWFKQAHLMSQLPTPSRPSNPKLRLVCPNRLSHSTSFYPSVSHPSIVYTNCIQTFLCIPPIVECCPNYWDYYSNLKKKTQW